MGNDEKRDVEKIKRYLKRYKKNLACIERLENRLLYLTSRIENIGSPKMSDMPRGGTPVTTADLIADKIDLEERIKRLKAKSIDLKKDTYKEIDKVNDVRYVEVLECLFIDCLDPLDTSIKLKRGLRHVQRLYSEALQELINYTTVE